MKNYNQNLYDFNERVIKRKRYNQFLDVRSFEPVTVSVINKLHAIIYYYSIKKPWDRNALRKLMGGQIKILSKEIRTKMAKHWSQALEEKLNKYDQLELIERYGYDRTLSIIKKDLTTIVDNKEIYKQTETDIKAKDDIINKQQIATTDITNNFEVYYNLKGVASSWIEGLKYERNTQHLWLQAHGKWYIWIKIDEKVYDNELNPSKNSFGSTYTNKKGTGSGIGTKMWSLGVFFNIPDLGGYTLSIAGVKSGKWTSSTRKRVLKWSIAQINKAWNAKKKSIKKIMKVSANLNIGYTGFVISAKLMGALGQLSPTLYGQSFKMEVITPSKQTISGWERQNLRSYYRDILSRKNNIEMIKDQKKVSKKIYHLKRKEAKMEWNKKSLNIAIKNKIKYKKGSLKKRIWKRFKKGNIDPRQILKKKSNIL